jgi:hypothetical protein
MLRTIATVVACVYRLEFELAIVNTSRQRRHQGSGLPELRRNVRVDAAYASMLARLGGSRFAAASAEREAWAALPASNTKLPLTAIKSGRDTCNVS